MECYEFSGESLLHLDYKVFSFISPPSSSLALPSLHLPVQVICPSSTKLDPMVVVILLEVLHCH